MSVDLQEVHVSGEIDMSNADELEDALARATASHDHVTVDVQDTTYIGLEGARVLLRAAEGLPRRGRLYVTRPTRQLLRVFDVLEASRVRKLVILPEC